jgi:hypothetical protein
VKVGFGTVVAEVEDDWPELHEVARATNPRDRIAVWAIRFLGTVGAS